MDSNTEIRRPRCGWERQSGRADRDRFGQSMEPSQPGAAAPYGSAMSPRSTMPAGTVMPWMTWNMSCPNTGVGPLEQNYPAAMAYVPWQQWQDIYEPETALARGTIFPDMDLPFDYGRCGR